MRCFGASRKRSGHLKIGTHPRKPIIEFMRPRCVELARVLKKTGSFYYHCDWHASHYVKVMLEHIAQKLA